MPRLSAHFRLAEFTLSREAERLGIDMTPPAAVVAELTRLCEMILEPVRRHFNRPVFITSGYRPPELNRVVEGSPRSAHLGGRAADFVVAGMDPVDVTGWIARSDLMFDQVIDEFGRWTHAAIARMRQPSRRSALVASRRNGRVIYQPAAVEASV